MKNFLNKVTGCIFKLCKIKLLVTFPFPKRETS